MTLFPGIEVINIHTKESALGKGGISISPGDIDITPEFIKEKLGTTEGIVYDLSVKSINESAARAKARAYVRLKNPFEPSSLKVIQSGEIENGDSMFNTYSVSVGTKK